MTNKNIAIVKGTTNHPHAVPLDGENHSDNDNVVMNDENDGDDKSDDLIWLKG